MILMLRRIRCLKWTAGRSISGYFNANNAPVLGIRNLSGFCWHHFEKESDFFGCRKSFFLNNWCLKYYGTSEGSLDRSKFEAVCTETLDSLTEYFEELVESVPAFKNADVTYSDGVLTVHLGKSYGTYVINRQTPNLQIWLSSPTSGPKRYDFINGTWVYKHDNTTLHSLLDREIKAIVKKPVDFVEKCSYAKEKVNG